MVLWMNQFIQVKNGIEKKNCLFRDSKALHGILQFYRVTLCLDSTLELILSNKRIIMPKGKKGLSYELIRYSAVLHGILQS